MAKLTVSLQSGREIAVQSTVCCIVIVGMCVQEIAGHSLFHYKRSQSTGSWSEHKGDVSIPCISNHKALREAPSGSDGISS